MNRKPTVPERLLSAASELFAREGFEAVSVRQITSKAKANLGAVTYHFGSKEALFHAVFERVGTPFVERFARLAAKPGTPLERIASIVTMVLAEPDLPAPGMILRQLASDRPLPPPLVLMMQRNLATIASLVREGQADGSIREGDPGLLAMSVMAQPFLLRMATRIPRDIAGVDRADPDTQRRVVQHVVTTITRSLASTPEPRT